MANHRERSRLLDIAGADNWRQLRAIREEEQERLAAQLGSSPVKELMEELNELHDALIARTLQLAEEDMARLGHGAPPVPYAYLLFGSGGRREQTMASDQDSGLVYADPDDPDAAEACRRYYLLLAEKTVQALTELGYPLCEGNVIASNPEWCMSLGEWSARIDGWFEEPSWEHVRYLLIVADARCLAGDATLVEALRDRFAGDMLSRPVIAKRMMENTLRHKVLVGVFGQLLKERYGEEAGSLDIKYGAYIPMVNACRLLAVQAGIRSPGTRERIEALRETGVLQAEEAERAAEAFDWLLTFRLLGSSRTDNGQWSGSGKLPSRLLTRDRIEPLKRALKVGKRLQQRVRREMESRFGGR